MIYMFWSTAPLGLNTYGVYCSALHIYLVKALTLNSEFEILYFSLTIAVSFIFKGPDLKILDSQGVSYISNVWIVELTC